MPFSSEPSLKSAAMKLAAGNLKSLRIVEVVGDQHPNLLDCHRELRSFDAQVVDDFGENLGLDFVSPFVLYKVQNLSFNSEPLGKSSS
jgi:hypothetical protein